MKISKIYWRIVSLLFAFLFLTFLFPGSQHTYADGGAPNLAYIAGTAKGISVIKVDSKLFTHGIYFLTVNSRDKFLSGKIFY